MDSTSPEYTDMLINLVFRERDALLWRAVALAPRLDVCEALLRGEPVPPGQLDPDYRRALERHGST